MDTSKSDQFIKEWKAKDNPLKRGLVYSERVFQTVPSKLFPLLCPTTELDWIPGWNAEMLHTRSGYSEYNCVWKTTFFGPEEVWVCTRYEEGKAMEYSRVSENMAAKMDISLVDNLDGTTTGRWVVTISALNEAGNKAVESVPEAQAHLDETIDTLEYYVKHGIMMKR